MRYVANICIKPLQWSMDWQILFNADKNGGYYNVGHN